MDCVHNREPLSFICSCRPCYPTYQANMHMHGGMSNMTDGLLLVPSATSTLHSAT